MKKFHITVKDNEDGTVYIDADSCAIIGAVEVEGGTQALGMTKARLKDAVKTLIAVEDVANRIKDDDPILTAAVEFFKKINIVKEEEN